ncbi:MAG: phage/plasmid primase, P4 family [Chloroflexi bacterium]|nr:phage/plasmid primase, P4 family [Chloroflexota bacterium]
MRPRPANGLTPRSAPAAESTWRKAASTTLWSRGERPKPGWVASVTSGPSRRVRSLTSAEAKLKALSGRDPIPARFMRGEWFSFMPEFKLMLATNHKPVIRGTDAAIWDRIRLVPFEVRIPEAEEDQELPSKLRDELPGILAWAVQGCLDWQRNGLGTPGEVRVATSQYRAEMDTLADFLEDLCVVDANHKSTAGALYEEYRKWCDGAGEKYMRQKEFGQQLDERGFARGREGKDRTRIWMGIGLRGSEQAAELPWTEDVVADATGRRTQADAISDITGANEPSGGLYGKTRPLASAEASRPPTCRACGRSWDVHGAKDPVQCREAA